MHKWCHSSLCRDIVWRQPLPFQHFLAQNMFCMYFQVKKAVQCSYSLLLSCHFWTEGICRILSAVSGTTSTDPTPLHPISNRCAHDERQPKQQYTVTSFNLCGHNQRNSVRIHQRYFFLQLIGLPMLLHRIQKLLSLTRLSPPRPCNSSDIYRGWEGSLAETGVWIVEVLCRSAIITGFNKGLTMSKYFDEYH